MTSMEFALLDDFCQTIKELFINYFSSSTTGESKFSREAIDDPIVMDEGNSQVTFQMMQDGFSAAPDPFSSMMRHIVDDVFARLKILEDTDLVDMTAVDWVELETVTKFNVGFAQLLDFFNDQYESKVAFTDKFQYFDTPNEDFKTSPATHKNVVHLIIMVVTLLSPEALK